MKRKTVIFTAAGVLLALLTAFGGWIGLGYVLDRQTGRLFTLSGSVPVAVPPGQTPSEPPAEDKPSENRGLTLAEINAVQAFIQENYNTRPHAPLAGQMTMEEAVRSAKDGLQRMGKSGLFPAAALENSSSTSAVLQTYVADTNAPLTGLDPEHSFWDITLSGGHSEISLLVHARSGVIWQMQIQAQDNAFKDVKIQTLLETYALYLNLHEHEYLKIYDDHDKQFGTRVFLGADTALIASLRTSGGGISNTLHMGIGGESQLISYEERETFNTLPPE